MPRLLSIFILKQYIMWLAIVTGALILLISIGGYVESLRLVNKLNGETIDAAIITALTIPELLLALSPFIILFSSVVALIRLNESQSLSIMRATGLSIWQISSPILLATLALSLMLVLALDPIVSKTSDLKERFERKLEGRDDSLNLLSTGVWVRLSGETENYIIHGEKVKNISSMQMENVDLLIMSKSNKLIDQISSNNAEIVNGMWRFTLPDGSTRDLVTNETIDATDLREKLIDPQKVPIWRLPERIESGAKAGLTMTAHELRFHLLLATPLFLSLMVFIAIAFSIPRGRIVSMSSGIMIALTFGFLANATSQIVAKISQLAFLPTMAAAWMPIAILLLITISLILEREES